jgi:hypothetical protein
MLFTAHALFWVLGSAAYEEHFYLALRPGSLLLGTGPRFNAFPWPIVLSIDSLAGNSILTRRVSRCEVTSIV